MNGAFIVRLLITSVLAFAGYFFLAGRLPVNLVYPNYLYILIFFAVLTAAFHYGLSKSALAGTKHFIRFYMMATALKLFAYVGIIMIYALINKPGIMAFALCFLLHYSLFTVFEVGMAYKQFGSLKNSSSAGPKELQS
jgi:hypothetical protein